MYQHNPTTDLDVPIRYTAHDHVAAYQRLLDEADWQLSKATTPVERIIAHLWRDSAERGLLRWQGIVRRMQP